MKRRAAGQGRETEAGDKWGPWGRAPPERQQPGATEPLARLLTQEPSQLQHGGFSRVATPARPRSGTRGAGRREAGSRLGNVVTGGSPGEGPGGENLRRGGAREGPRGRDPAFPGPGSPPGSQPHAERPHNRASPPPRWGSPTPLTWLGCSACSEDAIFPRPD